MYRPAGMFRRTPEERADQEVSWRRTDQAFFAAGACHILAWEFVARNPAYGVCAGPRLVSWTMRSAGSRNEMSLGSNAVSLEYPSVRPAASIKTALVGTWCTVRRARILKGAAISGGQYLEIASPGSRAP